MIGKIFKLLPIRETCEKTFLENFKSLMQELVAGEKILLNGGFYIELINMLETLPELPHKYKAKSKFKKRIIECIDVVEKMRKNMEEQIDGQDN